MLATENGIATGNDTARVRYTRAALEGLADAIDAGAEVLGCIHWTLIDIWEAICHTPGALLEIGPS